MPTKNETIKTSIKTTREKHKNMSCRVFEVKIIANKLSHKKKELLNQLFCEAKWFRNSELAKGYENMDRNAKTAVVKVGDSFEERGLSVLGSQMRQDIVDSLKSEIHGLAAKKKHGEKIGALKFKSCCNSVPLRQYGTTYRIDFKSNTISIQNMSKFPLKVRGLKQIPENADIANARLIRKPSGLYFHITVYIPVEKAESTGAVCGIDFGISHNLTLDNGMVYDIAIPETKAVKLASRRVNKARHRGGYGETHSKKKPRNHYRRVQKLRVAYEKLNNIKRDHAVKIVHELVTAYDFIAIQDEMIANWHKGLFGKQVQHSAMGIIKMRLKTNPKTHIVERSFPSTQICPICGKNTKHTLDRREYNCQYCNYHHSNRDVKAATSILTEALRQAVNA